MPQKLIQSQEQKAVQVQKLTQQQMLAVKMLEMPLTELEQNIQAEIDDNPAMESASPDDLDSLDNSEMSEMSEPSEMSEMSEMSEQSAPSDYEIEERKSALDEALSNIGMDDRMPEANADPYYGGADSADYEEMVYGEQTSFYDSLKSQMMDVELTDRQQEIMEYIIGSLDNDGLLRKTADSICDELAIYHNIDCSEEEI